MYKDFKTEFKKRQVFTGLWQKPLQKLYITKFHNPGMTMITQSPIFYLAPLRGITDSIFRNAFENHFGKFDFMLAPFIPTVKGTVVAPSIIKDILPEKNDIKRLIPQIIGNNAEEIIVLASRMTDLGYTSINLNMGCPHTPVTRKKRGSGLLPFPELVDSLLEKVVPSLTCKFSVKLRLGLQDEHEISSIIPVLNKYPLYEVIIHPRTGAQMYKGKADLDCFEKYYPSCVHPIVYNGDIFSLNDFNQVKQRFPVITRFMTGRGVIQNPFLLMILKEGKNLFDISKVHSFHDEIYEKNQVILSGPAHLLGKMKGLWSYLALPLPHGKKLLKQIQRVSSVSAYNKAIDNYFNLISSV